MSHRMPITNNAHSRSEVINSIQRVPESYVVTFTRTIYLNDNDLRAKALRLARSLKPGWVVELKKRKRSEEQNKLMWVLLSKISRAKPHGIKKTPESWKFVMLHECKHECQFEIGLDGKPFEVGLSTSNLKVDQMSELIEYIYWFGAEYGVDLSDTRKAA